MRRTYDVELSIWTLKNQEKNREWKENFVLTLSKIESRKRIVSYHSRKSRVEREMETIKFSRSREKFLFLLSIFLSRARLLSMPGPYNFMWQWKRQKGPYMDPVPIIGTLWVTVAMLSGAGHCRANVVIFLQEVCYAGSILYITGPGAGVNIFFSGWHQ